MKSTTVIVLFGLIIAAHCESLLRADGEGKGKKFLAIGYNPCFSLTLCRKFFFEELSYCIIDGLKPDT